MKKRALLILTLFLILSRAGFGDGSSYVSNFNAYVNSPEGSSGSSIDKNINLNQATSDKAGRKSEETDTKPVWQGILTKWKACAVDSDCTAGVVDCVSWEPLNKKYLKKLTKNLRSCSASVDPGFQPEAICFDRVCKTTEKTTNVSWEEWLSKIK